MTPTDRAKHEAEKLINAGLWAVIYCRKQGSLFAGGRLRSIEKSMARYGADYTLMRCRRGHNAEEVAMEAVGQGYGTIIIVGGDSDLNLALNGIARAVPPGVGLPVIGVLPNGLFNDFARFWGMGEGMHDGIIRSFVSRRTRRVDMGVCSFEQDGERHVRFFHDCVNIGLVALISNLTQRTRRFWGVRSLAFITSAVLMLFQRTEYRLKFEINREYVDKRVMTMCVGNALGYGQTPSAVPYNGLLDVSVVSAPRIAQLFNGMWLLLTGRFLEHKDVMAWRTDKVGFESVGKARVSIDGRMIAGKVENLNITIRKELFEMLLP